MRGDGAHSRPAACRVLGTKKDASFQVIMLGSSGGPREDTITGMLVRTTLSEWRKGSVIAVDGGTHLASIIRILEQYMPLNSEKIPERGYSKVLEEGPFAGVRFPHFSAKANALYFFREILHSFLITHSHLDHLSGMAINTPALEFGREAKAIVALPFAIDAIKSHIFNDAIWPNLSDEGHGVGFVTYRRLIEGGNSRLGFGESRGYVNVAEGLATKCWSVSHGKCHRRPHSMSSHQRGESFPFGIGSEGFTFPARRMSRISDDLGYMAAMSQHQSAMIHQVNAQLPPGTPGATTDSKDHMFEPVSSSAFFIRNDESGQEILIFGDIEPDSVSMAPRNHIVWNDAAAKVAAGNLKGIFIECSYDDSVHDADLYGHLCPRHLIAELTFLAKRVMAARSIPDENPLSNGASRPISQPREFNIQQPPTPTELKRKRKRGLNGTTTPELPSVEFGSPRTGRPTSTSSPRVGATSASKGRRKTTHEAPAGSTNLPSPGVERRATKPDRSARAPSAPAHPRPHHGRTARAPSAPAMSIQQHASFAPLSPGSRRPGSSQLTAHQQQPNSNRLPEPLKGVTVHLIHVKDTLLDGPSPRSVIERELREMGSNAGLGCTFEVTLFGDSIWV